jgi:hypothetical protein
MEEAAKVGPKGQPASESGPQMMHPGMESVRIQMSG